jgi:hypothetical protein
MALASQLVARSAGLVGLSSASLYVWSHLSALLSYRVAAGVLVHLLPVETGASPETLRG